MQTTCGTVAPPAWPGLASCSKQRVQIETAEPPRADPATAHHGPLGAGAVAGPLAAVSPDAFSSLFHAVVWKNGKATVLPPMGSCGCERYEPEPTAINDVAVSFPSLETRRSAYLWDLNGETVELPTLDPSPGQPYRNAAFDVDQSGRVVMGTGRNPVGAQRAIRWTDRVPHELGLLPGYKVCEATGLNEQGDVVGTSSMSYYFDPEEVRGPLPSARPA